LARRLKQLILACAIFAKQKPNRVERKILYRRNEVTKEVPMEYLVLVAVVSTVALYALIIVGCLKQPEW
jgi:hypothetical protein